MTRARGGLVRPTGLAAGVRLMARDTPWGDRLRAYAPDLSLDPGFIRNGTSWEHELAVLRRVVRPGDCVVDVGASFGYLSCFLAHLAGPDGRVHALEPSRAMRSLLLDNVERNGHPTVKAHRLALGSATGHTTLWLSKTNLGRHSLRTANVPGLQGGERVPQMTGDDFWRKKLKGQPVGLLKMDVEGSELAVLQSSPRLLRATREVWLEFWPDGIEATGLPPYNVLPVLQAAGLQTTCFNLVTGNSQRINTVRSLRALVARVRRTLAGSPILYLHARRPRAAG